MFIAVAQTLIIFTDSIRNSFILSFDSRSTDRKTVDTQSEYQVDIGSAQNINSPKYLIVTHRRAARMGVPNKANNVAIFENLNVRKYHVDIDGVRYPRDGVSIDYTSSDYPDRYRDLKVFYKECVGEELLNLFIRYTDMKNKYPIHVIDLRFQVDRTNPKKLLLFQEYIGATNIARLFIMKIR